MGPIDLLIYIRESDIFIHKYAHEYLTKIILSNVNHSPSFIKYESAKCTLQTQSIKMQSLFNRNCEKLKKILIGWNLIVNKVNFHLIEYQLHQVQYFHSCFHNNLIQVFCDNVNVNMSNMAWNILWNCVLDVSAMKLVCNIFLYIKHHYICVFANKSWPLVDRPVQ